MNEYLTAWSHAYYEVVEQNDDDIYSPLNNASLATFCVEIGQLFESPESFKVRKNSYLASILLQKRQNIVSDWAFKDSLRLEYLTNLVAKGIKWSVIYWARNLIKLLFKNILFNVNYRPLNNRSLHRQLGM